MAPLPTNSERRAAHEAAERLARARSTARALASLDILHTELGELRAVLDEVYPGWQEKTEASLSDASRPFRCIPIRAAIHLLKSQ